MTENIPKKMKLRFEEITAITDSVCREHLNKEYTDMSRKLAAALARKRPSPLARGRANSWACGIVYALGFVNFLFDKSFPPYLRADGLCTLFGVSKATGYNKSKVIRDLFDLTRLDTNWSLPSQMDQNPMAWMILVNDLIIDVRQAPLQFQEEALRKGLIPYLPGGGEPSPAIQGQDSLPLQVRDSVVVKAGVKAPDFGDDLSGWQGYIVEIDTRPPGLPLVTIIWDSVTLRKIPLASIESYEREGFDWTTMALYITELAPASPRDTFQEVDIAVMEIYRQIRWLDLEEEGERIQQVLDGIDPDDTDACLEAWFDYLDKKTDFPFDAKVVESDPLGSIQSEDAVRVISFNDVLEDYGIIVNVKKDRHTYQLPLADVEVTDNNVIQYQSVNDYALWFVNR